MSTANFFLQSDPDALKIEKERKEKKNSNVDDRKVKVVLEVHNFPRC